jgi:hypothetical protein
MMTVGALSAIILQSVLPISSVLLVAGMIIGINILAILISAALLTAKGVHPHEVSWLHWLHGEVKTSHQAVYASCPLTCGVVHSISIFLQLLTFFYFTIVFEVFNRFMVTLTWGLLKSFSWQGVGW